MGEKAGSSKHEDHDSGVPWAGFSVAGLVLVLEGVLGSIVGSSAPWGRGGSVTAGRGKVVDEA